MLRCGKTQVQRFYSLSKVLFVKPYWPYWYIQLTDFNTNRGLKIWLLHNLQIKRLHDLTNKNYKVIIWRHGIYFTKIFISARKWQKNGYYCRPGFNLITCNNAKNRLSVMPNINFSSRFMYTAAIYVFEMKLNRSHKTILVIASVL